MAGSIVVQATLEALGADYQMRYVDMGAGEHLATEYLEVTPSGRVPALGLPDGTTIGETGAIVTLLGELHPTNPITPQPGEPDRGTFLFWLNVMTTAGYLTASRVGHPERFARDESAVAQVKQQADKDFASFFTMIDQSITGETFLLGRGLTVLDFYVTMLSEWCSDRDALLEELPRLQNLCAAVRDTAAYSAAIQTHSMPVLEEAG